MIGIETIEGTQTVRVTLTDDADSWVTASGGMATLTVIDRSVQPSAAVKIHGPSHIIDGILSLRSSLGKALDDGSERR